MIIGLTGCIGSGKSKVGEIFAEMDAEVLDADNIVHAAQKPGEALYEPIVGVFGQDILYPDKSINRKALAEIVFECDESMKKLTDICFPYVSKKFDEARWTNPTSNIIILMAPLLFETGMDVYCDKTITVSVSQNIRYDRLFLRSNMSSVEVEIRLARQFTDEKKETMADFVINNSGNIERTKEQVQDIWKIINSENKC